MWITQIENILKLHFVASVNIRNNRAKQCYTRIFQFIVSMQVIAIQ